MYEHLSPSLYSSLQGVAMKLQQTMMLIGVFTFSWGLTVFGRCLSQVLLGKYDKAQPFKDGCVWHASWGMVCVTGLLFVVARASTVGLMPLGQTFAAFTYAGGMISFVLTIGIAMWAQTGDREHKEPAIRLSRIFGAQFIMMLAFAAVGVLGS